VTQCFELQFGRTSKEACYGIRAFIEAYSSQDALDQWDAACEELWPHRCENFPDETPEVLAEMGEACTDWVWFWSPQEAVCWENPERGEVGHREEEDRELLEYPCNCLYCRGITDEPL
jgi:hypothetical protein